jgi:hypothetical protein
VSTWWDEYCDLYPDYIPTTWPYLKLAMRYKFVPSSYTRKMLHKLENLEQGSDTVEEYYNALKITLFHCGLEESEESFMDRFWDGLNHDIEDLLMLEKYYSINCMFRLACKVEQKIKRRLHGTNKCKKAMDFFASPPTMIDVSSYLQRYLVHVKEFYTLIAKVLILLLQIKLITAMSVLLCFVLR